MRIRFSAAELGIVLAIACLAVIGYKLSPRLRADAGLVLTAPTSCDLNENLCSVDLPDGGRVDLSIAPRPIPVVKPLRIDVRISGMIADQVEIDFAGRTMDMGHNRSTLASTGDGNYHGSAMLPVCVTGRMDWQATLRLDTPRGRISARFFFAAPQTH